MDRLAGEIGIPHREQHCMPALMQTVEDLDRQAWIELDVGELCPLGFVVRLDGRLVLSQRQPKPDEGVHMTIGDVVHNLARRPAALAIRLIEPGAGHRRLELARKAGDGGDTVVALFGGLRLVEHEFSGRETWVHGSKSYRKALILK